jgi:hypothetical protein
MIGCASDIQSLTPPIGSRDYLAWSREGRKIKRYMTNLRLF